MAQAIVELRNAEKRFGRKVVFAGFNLTINEGELVALCGPSGSGKTTLLNIVGLLDGLDRGDIVVGGHKNPKANSSKAQKVIRDEIGYIFQSFALVEGMTAEKNLLMALRYVKAGQGEKRSMVRRALKSVGLQGFEGAKVFELSGGEQQRVSLARCMVKPGRLLLADELTGSLDADNRDRVMALIREMNRAGRTVVIVTHDQNVANACSRVISLG